MKRTIKLTESDLNRIISKLLKEGVDVDQNMSKLRQYVPLLQMINNKINMRDVIMWFNENNVDYVGMNDLEMIIIYIGQEIVKILDMGKKIKLGKKPGNKKNIVKNAKRIKKNIELIKSI